MSAYISGCLTQGNPLQVKSGSCVKHPNCEDTGYGTTESAGGFSGSLICCDNPKPGKNDSCFGGGGGGSGGGGGGGTDPAAAIKSRCNTMFQNDKDIQANYQYDDFMPRCVAEITKAVNETGCSASGNCQNVINSNAMYVKRAADEGYSFFGKHKSNKHLMILAVVIAIMIILFLLNGNRVMNQPSIVQRISQFGRVIKSIRKM